MDAFRIQGGTALSGTVAVSGSKNAALPIMAASILAEGPVRLEGVPDLTDVDTMLMVLEDIGVTASRLPGSLLLNTVDSRPVKVSYPLASRMRASFCALGPLLARRGRAVIALPGGCAIGDRPIDLHLRGLAALGANFRVDRGYIVASAKRLTGATIDLAGPRGPTVTGTANVMSAAVLARGTTTIHNAAREPEIVDLGSFLNSMGAQVSGLGTATIRIRGVRELGQTSYRVMPDRIEAATFLIAGAITGGDVTVKGAEEYHLGEILRTLHEIGFAVVRAARGLSLAATRRPRPTTITARPYPGIPTDLQSQLMALLCLTSGKSVIRDRVFPERFRHVAELQRLGARIERRGSRAIVQGIARFSGATVTACDLRASAALVLAGLAADGETTVRGIHHLERGYERLAEKLGSLGAKIEHVPSVRAMRYRDQLDRLLQRSTRSATISLAPNR